MKLGLTGFREHKLATFARALNLGIPKLRSGSLFLTDIIGASGSRW